MIAYNLILIRLCFLLRCFPQFVLIRVLDKKRDAASYFDLYNLKIRQLVYLLWSLEWLLLE